MYHAKSKIVKHILSFVAISFFIFLAIGSTDTEPEVKWSNYSPMVKTRIDNFVKEKDCNGLQSEFDAADKNSDLQRNRTGEGNADLMAYLDEKMKECGCYNKN